MVVHKDSKGTEGRLCPGLVDGKIANSERWCMKTLRELRGGCAPDWKNYLKTLEGVAPSGPRGSETRESFSRRGGLRRPIFNDRVRVWRFERLKGIDEILDSG
ncbi:hypothetical protein NPIL_679901 [Nephila pilipes]|uniref:Uncharacterized protein n=1 Tax=Nephila pilipes TaxID=299642 RepID=A0A8X6U8V0_NEPPI|nr:hypothetical protein NPIL_679901 [Nephila pilipes]